LGSGVEKRVFIVQTEDKQNQQEQNDEHDTTIPVGTRIGETVAKFEQLAAGECVLVQLRDSASRELSAGSGVTTGGEWGTGGKRSAEVETVSE
jgi:hypothetical protein